MLKSFLCVTDKFVKRLFQSYLIEFFDFEDNIWNTPKHLTDFTLLYLNHSENDTIDTILSLIYELSQHNIINITTLRSL